MKVILDRFEGEFGIVELEDMTFVEIPRVLLDNAKEGDVISISVDIEETERQKKEIESLMDDLFQ